MWERKKVSTWGITSYDIHLQSGRFIFPAGKPPFYFCESLSWTEKRTIGVISSDRAFKEFV